jgi:hypothetical protein
MLERFLTIRWNNLISLGLGLVVLVFVAVALTTSTGSAHEGFVGMAVIGSLF